MRSSEPRASPEELVHTHPADTRVILAQVNLGLTPLSRESGGAGTLIVIHLKAKGLAAKVSCGLLFLCDCSIGMPCLGNLTECVLRETKGEGRNRVKGRLWLTRSVQLPPRRQGCSRQSSMFSSQCLHGKWLGQVCRNELSTTHLPVHPGGHLQVYLPCARVLQAAPLLKGFPFSLQGSSVTSQLSPL